jgi:beta-lactamase regulating signal transducer with metallopeptidase domain
MDPMTALVLGSLKAMILLLVASGLAITLRGRPARLRAVVWSTALAGTLVIPAVAEIVPTVDIALPVPLSSGSPVCEPAIADPLPTHIAAAGGQARPLPAMDDRASGPPPGWRPPSLETVLLVVWIIGVAALLARQSTGLVGTRLIILRARSVTDPDWLELLGDVRQRVGCRSSVRLVVTDGLDIPAVFGVVRPTVILPTSSASWLDDRRQAVLEHELIHLVRRDWILRVVAHVARAVYWFNPLAWWAVRRLDLEQEMACDEEVLALGHRASSYACHLLGIARSAVHRPATAVAGLEMARRSDLEERIMRLLQRPTHRRIGFAVMLPAVVLTAALVPAIAAVQPTEPERKASPALRAAIADMREAEELLEPQLEQLEKIEIDMAPVIAEIEALEVEIDHEAIARIQAEMEPYLEEIEKIAMDMEPVREQLEAMQEKLETMTLHIEDGTFDEIQKQIHEQMAAHQFELQSIHVDMAPYHEQIEKIHEQLEPLHDRIADLTAEQTARIHEQLELDHELLEQHREELERFHEQLEPMHEEMEQAGHQIRVALELDVADVLRSHLAPVTSPDAPFDEAAARVVDAGSIRVDDDTVEVIVSKRETREILTDLFEPHRIGGRGAFDTALETAVSETSNLEILVD